MDRQDLCSSEREGAGVYVAAARTRNVNVVISVRSPPVKEERNVNIQDEMAAAKAETIMKLLNRACIILLTLQSCALLSIAQPQPPIAKILFPVEKDSKWDFIDRTGKIVIPLQF